VATTVAELVPGDLVVNTHRSAVFIARTQHPLWPHLQLVIWHLHEPGYEWSLDALDARQEVGDITPASDEDRAMRLRSALLIGELP
jgi:uncharacterized protein (DUF779 family)